MMETPARLAIEIADHHLADGTVEQRRDLARAILNVIGICEKEVAGEIEAARLLGILDTARLNFIERWAQHSPTGVSLDCHPEIGFRFMTHHKVDRGQDNARDAIDAAMALRAPLKSVQRGEVR